MNSENIKKVTNQAIEQLIMALNEDRNETLTRVMPPPGVRIPWRERCKPGPRHHPFAPSLRLRRNLFCREQDTWFSQPA